MKRVSVEPTPQAPLRRGWTTGACATAAAKAAFLGLRHGKIPQQVTIVLPSGQKAGFAIDDAHLAPSEQWSRAAVVKDAGDDPDVTHGVMVCVTIQRLPRGQGIVFRAGSGVGTVTKKGLPVPVGSPAINPKPQEMIRNNLREANGGTLPDLELTVAIPGGQRIALQTWNPKLGIKGGLSILGTSGIVIPYSCSSWIHSIHSGIDVARANGVESIALATGSTSEGALRTSLGFCDQEIIGIGDFFGATCKYLRRRPVLRVTLGAGMGKLVKIAQGAKDLHAKRSQVDFGTLAEWVGGIGGSDGLQRQVRDAPTVLGVLQILPPNLDLPSFVAARARDRLRQDLRDATEVTVVAVDRDGGILAQTTER